MVSVWSECLSETPRSPWSLLGNLSPRPRSYSRLSATYQGNHKTVLEAKENLLVTAMLISPDLGVSSPSWGSCDIPEVRRGSRLRELSLAKSPSADRLLAGWPLVSLSMSKATLSVQGTFGWGKKAIPRYNGEYSMCNKPMNLVTPPPLPSPRHTNTLFSHCGCPQIIQERNAWVKRCLKFLLQSTLKSWRKKQKKH